MKEKSKRRDGSASPENKRSKRLTGGRRHRKKSRTSGGNAMNYTDLQYLWHSSAHSPNTEVLDDQPHVLRRKIAKQSTDGARGHVGFSRGYHVFRFDFNDKPWGSHCALGVCTTDTVMQASGYTHLLGTKEDSWAWDIPSRELMHAGSTQGTLSQAADIPKSIVMTLDLEQGTLSFDLGKGGQQAFTGISANKELFPCVSMVYGLMEVGVYLLESKTNKDPENGEIEAEIGSSDKYEIKAAFSSGLMDYAADQDMQCDMGDEQDLVGSKQSNPATSQTRQSLMNMRISADSMIPVGYLGQADLMEISDLPEADAYLVQVAHGWDSRSMGGRLELLPNAPCVCRTTANFDNRIQAVRGRKGFTTGIHRWRLEGLDFRLIEESVNWEGSLLIGVVNEKHKVFNYNSDTQQFGENTWLWDVKSNCLHQRNIMTHFAGPSMPDVDLSNAVDLLLDMNKHTVTFIHQGQMVPCSLQHIQGNMLYPLLVYRGDCSKAVRLAYLLGSTEHVNESLQHVRGMNNLELDAMLVTKSLNSNFNLGLLNVELAPKLRPNYGWGKCSKNAHIQNKSRHKAVIKLKDNKDLVEDILAANTALPSGKHIIDFEVSYADQLILGLASPGEDNGNDNNCGKEYGTAFGSSLIKEKRVWAWDVASSKLYQAGHFIGRYPPLSKSVEWQEVRCIRMTVLLTASDSHVSFSLLTNANDVTDLGVAFLDVPCNVHPVSSVAVRQGSCHVTMIYQSGPQWFVESLQRKSSICTLL